MNEIVVGLIGSGAAATLHAEAYSEIAKYPVCIRTVCSLDDTVEVFAEKYGIPNVTGDYSKVLSDPEINVIDIATPPNLHMWMIRAALDAGKYVICEKPLTGYFKTTDVSGAPISKKCMYKAVMTELDQLRSDYPDIEKRLMYAENIIYAPAVMKALDFVRARNGKILFIKAEESHCGSLADHANHWHANGGGAFMRVGCHPLSTALFLKQMEGKIRGEEIYPVSIIADMGVVTTCLKDEEKTAIYSRPADVEDIAGAIITFSDGTKVNIVAGDMIIGGVKNPIEIYTNNGVYLCRIEATDMLKVYNSDDTGLEDVFFTPKLGQKAGWQSVFLEKSHMRGYKFELQDFCASILEGREPLSGFRIAYETAKLIYGAYYSAEEGRRINF